MLDQILSGEATETVVERIHEYLATMSEDVRGGKIPMDEFIIFKVTSFDSLFQGAIFSPTYLASW